jgi:hypothetical protein
MKTSVFWDIMKCSPVKVNQQFGGIYCFNLQGLRISNKETSKKQEARCLASSLILKMEVICSFRMSVDFYWTTLHFIAEGFTVLV